MGDSDNGRCFLHFGGRLFPYFPCERHLWVCELEEDGEKAEMIEESTRGRNQVLCLLFIYEITFLYRGSS